MADTETEKIKGKKELHVQEATKIPEPVRLGALPRNVAVRPYAEIQTQNSVRSGQLKTLGDASHG